MLLGARQKLLELVAKTRLPAIYTLRELADAGGLICYGTDNGAMRLLLILCVILAYTQREASCSLGRRPSGVSESTAFGNCAANSARS
jgi:hypothetical protein